MVVDDLPRRQRILIIDDEPFVAAAMRRQLADEHDVRVTFDANEALERVRAGQLFDVIFCDLLMPALNGMDFYRALEALCPAQARRVVFLSGGVYSEHMAAFLAALPNPFVDKPFTRAQLVAAIHTLAKLE